MSIESAKAYVERMKTDEEFRNKILACTDAKKRMELVKSEGFDFTENDIKVVSAEFGDGFLSKAVGGQQVWERSEFWPLDPNRMQYRFDSLKG